MEVVDGSGRSDVCLWLRFRLSEALRKRSEPSDEEAGKPREEGLGELGDPVSLALILAKGACTGEPRGRTAGRTNVAPSRLYTPPSRMVALLWSSLPLSSWVGFPRSARCESLPEIIAGDDDDGNPTMFIDVSTSPTRTPPPSGRCEGEDDCDSLTNLFPT